MTAGLRVLFQLRRVEDVEAWGVPGNRTLHWFGLTDGWQCLDTAAGRLLELASPGEHPWLGYPVVRLFESLLSAWPAIAEPVPGDVASRFLRWRPHADAVRIADETTEDMVDLLDEACSWWGAREILFDHLQPRPHLHLWRTGSEVNLLWEAGPFWALQHAHLFLPLAEVRDAIATFSQEFLRAMAGRVEAIEHDGWTRTDCTLDVAQLAANQREWEGWAAAQLDRGTVTDWAWVRGRLQAAGAD